MARPAFSTHLSPDELKKLAETQIAQAMRLEAGPERLSALTVADALMKSGGDQETVAGIRATPAQLRAAHGQQPSPASFIFFIRFSSAPATRYCRV